MAPISITELQPPLFPANNRPAFTQSVRRLLPQLWAIVLSKALQSGIKAAGAIDAETDRDSGALTAILRVYLDANAAQALAFWNGLDSDLEGWMARLNTANRLVAQRDVSLRVHWFR